jgi:hypothetical protein
MAWRTRITIPGAPAVVDEVVRESASHFEGVRIRDFVAVLTLIEADQHRPCFTTSRFRPPDVRLDVVELGRHRDKSRSRSARLRPMRVAGGGGQRNAAPSYDPMPVPA